MSPGVKPLLDGIVYNTPLYQTQRCEKVQAIVPIIALHTTFLHQL
jgi:hypothetical protein